MNLESFKKRREALAQEKPLYRNLCTQCLQPEFGCYCAHVHKFDPKIKFIILIHPIEMKRRIATGRMSHLCLENSELIVGQDYSQHPRVNEILGNPKYQTAVLYPGRTAINLSETPETEKSEMFSNDKEKVIFVIDGTWATARKTMHLSQNLKTLPRLSFTPAGKSQFRVRKQPGAECFSTIEAIHQLIGLIGDHAGFNVKEKTHDRLIHVFNHMVERQIGFIKHAFKHPRPNAYRRPQKLAV